MKPCSPRSGSPARSTPWPCCTGACCRRSASKRPTPSTTTKQVPPQRHQVPLPCRAVGTVRGAPGEPGAGGLRRGGRGRLGSRGLHVRPHGPAAAAGDQHRARHDRPQPGAHGRARRRHRFRRAVLAGAGNQLRARGCATGGRMSLLRRSKPSAARTRTKKNAPAWLARFARIPWRRLAPAGAVLFACLAVLLVLRVSLNKPVEPRGDLRPLPARAAARCGEGRARIAAWRGGWSAWISNASPPPWKPSPGWIAPPWPAAGRVHCACRWWSRSRWRAGASAASSTSRGEVFVQDAQHIPAELPQLVGPAGLRGRDDGALPGRAGRA